MFFTNTMLNLALGLVETRGLVAAIEAADAMVKTSNVRLIGKERTDPAMITIKIIGETAAVRSAVEAGAAAAQKIGQLVSKHVIPRTADGLEEIIFEKSILTDDEIKELLGDGFESKVSSPAAIDKTEAEPAASELFEENNEQEPLEKYDAPSGSDRDSYREQLQQMTVHQLRNYARSVEGLSIYGRQISKANKEELISELLKAKFN